MNECFVCKLYFGETGPDGRPMGATLPSTGDWICWPCAENIINSAFEAMMQRNAE